MSGSAQQHINKDIVQNTKILIPSAKILNDFDNLIIPLFNKFQACYLKIKTLKVHELPFTYAISGKVDVSEM